MKWRILIIWAVLCGWFSPAYAVQFAEKAAQYGTLCYHNVIDESRQSAVPAKVEKEMVGSMQRQYFPQTITVQKLVQHFNWLKSNGYHPVSWQQVLDARSGKSKLPEKAVLLTFDDGYESFYRLVYPLLKAYKYPAVFAVVTSWLDTPVGGNIAYGKTTLPRNSFVSWSEVQEMHQSGLVEIASHTDNLHRSLVGNPYGSEFAAVLSGVYQNGRHETESEYKDRIRSDFRRSSDSIARQIGVRPRIMVWPYGQFNETAVKIAREEGFDSDMTLNDDSLNTPDQHHQGRELLDQESQLDFIQSYLENDVFEPSVQRIVHVDLDYIYDDDVQQTERNLDVLIERIAKYGISTVYLQAYADDNGDGVAEALYFPNRHMKMKADLFSRAAWQLMTRANVKVYAWMPMMAFDLGAGHEYVTNQTTGVPDKQHYLRLSPYSKANRKIVSEIYQDLAFYSRFKGILFHDDGFLTDSEGKNAGDVGNAERKTDDLIAYSDELKQALLAYSFNGKNELKTARNIYASVIMDNQAEQWFAQSLPKFVAAYDFTPIMAMPYMEHENAISSQQARNWLVSLTDKVKQSHVPLNKVVFELQANNWRKKKPISDHELVAWIKLLKEKGIRNIGYYPDDFLNNRPAIEVLRPYFSVRK